MKELLEWCEKQNGIDMPDIVTILNQHPSLTGYRALLMQLWIEATGDETGDQSKENVAIFYKRFPSLPIFRPLLVCPEAACHDYGVVSFMGLIGHMAEVHGKTGAQLAVMFQEFIDAKTRRSQVEP